MRAAAFTGRGGPENVELIELEAPTPAANEAVIRVEAAALNHHDLWLLKDDTRLDDDAFPFVSGVDLAGVVEAVGDDVSNVQNGDRVVLCPNLTCGTCQYCRDGPENMCANYGLYHGGFAEQSVVQADRLIRLPDSVSTRQAAAIPVAYMTAWHMLRRAEVTAGDRVFIPGATGGVGVAAVQLCRVRGAQSIGSSSSSAKLDRLAEIGVDQTIHTDDPDELRESITALGPVDAALNHLGGPYTQVGLDALRRGGRMVIVGRTAGSRVDLDVPSTYRRHLQVIGSMMGTQPELARLISLAADGAFEPVIGKEYPLDETAEAFADMADRDLFGKLLVRP